MKIARLSLSKTTELHFDWQHVLLLAAATFWGGFEGYLQSHADGLQAALQSPAALKGIAIPAIAYGFVALLMLAKTSILQAVGGGEPAKAQTPPTSAAAIFLIVSAGLFGLSHVACNPPKTPIFPAIEATITSDLEASDSDSQIASDVCKDLGGTALTDALCADVPDVIIGLVNVLLTRDGGIALSDRGYANARAYTQRHKAAP